MTCTCTFQMPRSCITFIGRLLLVLQSLSQTRAVGSPLFLTQHVLRASWIGVGMVIRLTVGVTVPLTVGVAINPRIVAPPHSDSVLLTRWNGTAVLAGIGVTGILVVVVGVCARTQDIRVVAAATAIMAITGIISLIAVIAIRVGH